MTVKVVFFDKRDDEQSVEGVTVGDSTDASDTARHVSGIDRGLVVVDARRRRCRCFVLDDSLEGKDS